MRGLRRNLDGDQHPKATLTVAGRPAGNPHDPSRLDESYAAEAIRRLSKHRSRQGRVELAAARPEGSRYRRNLLEP